MSIVWHRYLDQAFAAPQAHTRRANGSRTSAGLLPPRSAPLRAALRVIFAGAAPAPVTPPRRGPRGSSFRGSLDTPSTRQPSEPRMSYPLSHVRVLGPVKR